MTKIKICGITRLEDIYVVNQLGPDYIGFIFARSRRKISESKAEQLKKHLDRSIRTVGVFVNEDIHRIVSLCLSQTIDLIQLHGDENAEYIDRLKSLIPNKIIKAVQVRGRKDIEMALNLSCEYLLFDSYSPDEYGGSGKVFDWDLIEEIDKPFFLAGGLNAENIEEAIRSCNPYGVDVSSGVEIDGKKDPVKIRKFIDSVNMIS